MIGNYQDKKYNFPAFMAAILLLSSGLVSCNAHQKAAKLIGNSVKEQVSKFVQTEEVTIENKITNWEQLIPNPTVSDIFTEKTELIATY